MDCASFPTLWAELHLNFWDRFDPSCHVHRKHYPNLQRGDKIHRHHQVAFADDFNCPSITVYSPDWKESHTYQSRDGYRDNFRVSRSAHGHNWFGVTRIDIWFLPRDVPFYYWGKVFTGGLSAHTCQLRRLTSIHQATYIDIPAKAILTPMGQGITHAAWTFRRKAHEAFLTRTINDGWVSAPSYDIAIQRKVLSRLQLPYVPAA